MKALARSLAKQGEPLPVPWNIPVRLYPGTLIELLAAAGVGKSMFALNWAVHLAELGLPVLVHSTDTAYNDQAKRVVAMTQGIPTEEVDRNLDAWMRWLENSMLPIRWSEIPVDSATINELVLAETEYLGRAPALVVVDVVSDLLTEEESLGAYRKIFASLKRLSRKHNCAVLALNHVKVGYAAGGASMVEMSDEPYRVGGQISQIGLGIWREGDSTNRLGLHVWKNRTGRTGAVTTLAIDRPCALITDLHPRLYSP